MNEIKEFNETIFESIKHTDEYGNEYWLARELQSALEYKKWQKFINVIENAKVACEQSKFMIDEHFTQVGKTSKMPNGGVKNILEYKLSRYACYLIVQNADPKKEVRNTIKRLSGVMPEDLPTPKKSLKELEKEKSKQEKIEMK